MNPSILRGAALAACFASLAACSTPPPISPEAVGEVRPGSGILKGYLDRKDLPNALALLPPPPAAGSPAEAADLEAYRAFVGLRGSPRWELASRDADLSFPALVRPFACALGMPISTERTPHLAMLLRRSMIDAGLATYTAKDHYNRVRPFVARKEASCSPVEEPRLVKDGSYPSGHSALGWAAGLVLAGVAPDRADAVLARGYQYGQSRAVCGVHWQSDVDAGRVVGAAAVARLQAEPAFVAQMAEARREVAAMRAAGARPDTGCDADAAALRP